MALHILVLAGGSGTRLWPLSREALPKHLLPFGPQGESLLRATVERVAPIAGAVYLVTAASQAEACVAALEGGVGTAVSIIAEPAPRGTGPALGLAVHQIVMRDPDALIISVHADHHIGDVEAYRAAVVAAAGWAAATDGLATVGLIPTSPATGFGYIEVGEAEPPEAFPTQVGAGPGPGPGPELLAAAAALPAAHAIAFVEKPSADTAGAFVAGGRHLWNLGLFAWTASAFLAELSEADPELDARLVEVVAERTAGREDRASSIYADLTPVAVEPLVFERSRRLTVVRAAFGWSDLGSWSDLMASRAADADPDGNMISGEAVVVDSRDCLVDSRGGRTIVVVGADNLLVIDTGDTVLVMPAAASQQLKTVVERLRARGRRDLL